MFETWIRKQEKEIQLDVFSRISHHLSNTELVAVMNSVSSGRDLVDIHIEMGLLAKYRVDLFRIRQVVTEFFPEKVIG
ncbi:MAG: hypothetical protein OCD02_19225 [Spirochaetaceae bacterium]